MGNILFNTGRNRGKDGWSREQVKDYITTLNKIGAQTLNLAKQHQIGRAPTSGFRLRDMLKYCAEKGIEPPELTDEELEQFYY